MLYAPSIKKILLSVVVVSASAIIASVSVTSKVFCQPASDELKKYQQDLDKRIQHDKQIRHKEGQITDDEFQGLDAQKKGDYDQAEQLMKKALTECQDFYGPTHPKTALLLERLAIVYAHKDQPDQAEEYFKKSILTYENIESTGRDQVWGPVDGLKYLLDGRLQGISDEHWNDWVHRKYPNQADREQLIAKLTYIREHPMEKAKFDPSWGTVEKGGNQAVDNYLLALQKKVKGNWHAPTESPPRPAAVVLMLFSGDVTVTPYIYNSSRSKVFDQACMEAIKASAPYPHMPVDREKWALEFIFDQNGPGVPHESPDN